MKVSNGRGHSTNVLKCWNKVLEKLWNPHFWRFSKLGWIRPWATRYNLGVSPVFSRELVLPEAPLNPHRSVMLFPAASAWRCFLAAWFHTSSVSDLHWCQKSDFLQGFFAFWNAPLAFDLPCSLWAKAGWLAAGGGDGGGWRSGT